jgi:hypothetical protein
LCRKIAAVSDPEVLDYSPEKYQGLQTMPPDKKI